MNRNPPASAGAGRSALEHQHSDGRGMAPWLLIAVRYVLPGAIVVGGIVVMALGGETNVEGGAAIAGAGLAIYFLNLLLRMGVAGERQREAEDAAREHFDRHGRWPQ